MACTPRSSSGDGGGSPQRGLDASAHDQLVCIPFRLDVNLAVAGNRSGVGRALVWQRGSSFADPTFVAETVNATAMLDVSGGQIPYDPKVWRGTLGAKPGSRLCL